MQATIIIITIITNVTTKRSCLFISEKQKVAKSNIHRNYTQKSSTQLSHKIMTSVLASLAKHLNESRRHFSQKFLLHSRSRGKKKLGTLSLALNPFAKGIQTTARGLAMSGMKFNPALLFRTFCLFI